MARTAITDLQQQIEAVRREAFASGYATAMAEVRELASRAASGETSTASAPARRVRGRARGRPRARQAAQAAPAPTRRRRTTRARGRARTTARTATRVTRGTARGRRSASRRPQRGRNAQMISDILRAVAPRAVPPAEIRRALQQKGVSMAFTSIRHALGQLQQRSAAEQVGGSNTWRHRS